MGLRDAFVRMLSTRPDEPVDEDEPVELMTVPLFDGPLVVAELDDAGISASAVDAFSVVTQVASDARIMVRRGDIEAAQAALSGRSSPEIE